ncbi:MAG: hypothetical protein KGL67_02215 [Patescibacteria group bacterium]|nr:hypothetical protein [Patescibacteria group bacterium]
MKKFKFFFIIAIIVLIIIFANIGYYFERNWQYFFGAKHYSEQGDTETLKTYTSSKMGFEVKYPPSWTVQDNGDTVEINPISKKVQTTYFSVGLRSDLTSLDDVKEKLSTSVSLTPVQINNATGFEYNDGGSFEAIWLMHSGKVYVIRTYTSITSGGDSADQIFSTFKFIDESSVTYTNNDYGFTFSLPDDWKGYSVVKSTWDGTSQANTKVATGATLLIRNPNWTAEKHYEDIPIMIFTIKQWNSYIAGDFYTGAAPINASELARNNLYVFALPPRWNYDFSEGYQEAENILNTKPLHPFNL